MTTATILSIVFNFVAHGDNIQGYMNGDNHNTFAVVVIMTEYIVEDVLKAITYHQLPLKICTCGTIQGYATIKINHKNKVICT